MYVWAVGSGTHSEGVILLEHTLVERVVLIGGASRWLRCDAADTLMPSLNVMLLVQDQ